MIGPWRLLDRSGEGEDSPPVTIHESYSPRVEPGSRLQTSHMVENMAMDGIVVTLQVQTALGSEVSIYRADDLGRPYLNQPIDGPLALDYFES